VPVSDAVVEVIEKGVKVPRPTETNEEQGELCLHDEKKKKTKKQLNQTHLGAVVALLVVVAGVVVVGPVFVVRVVVMRVVVVCVVVVCVVVAPVTRTTICPVPFKKIKINNFTQTFFFFLLLNLGRHQIPLLSHTPHLRCSSAKASDWKYCHIRRRYKCL
jgi:uncharacterized membrane protein